MDLNEKILFFLEDCLDFPFNYRVEKKLKYNYFPPEYGQTSGNWYHNRLGFLRASAYYVIIEPKITLNDWFNCEFKNKILKKFPYEYNTFQKSADEKKQYYNQLNISSIGQVLDNLYPPNVSPKDSQSYYQNKTSFYFDYNREQSKFLYSIKNQIQKISDGIFENVSVDSNLLCLDQIQVQVVRPNYKTKETKGIIEKVQQVFPNLNFDFRRSKSNQLLQFRWNSEDPKNWSEEREEIEKIKVFNGFVESAKNKFGEIYDYDYDNFFGMDKLMSVFCKKHEKNFDVIPTQHLKGKRCPLDIESKGENIVRVILEKHKIPFIQYHKMEGCFSVKNGKCYLLEFDFYLPTKKTVIEYDGGQHFAPVSKFGGVQSFQRTQMLDEIKNKFCRDNQIKMIRIPYTIPEKNIENFIMKGLK